MEEAIPMKIQNYEEKAGEANFTATHSRERDGRYVVRLPRPCINQLGSSLITADKRF